jgi:hypothetical protein
MIGLLVFVNTGELTQKSYQKGVIGKRKFNKRIIPIGSMKSN